MKKTFLSIITCLLMAGGATAEVVVTVSDVEALPDETVTFSLSFSGGQADTYTSLQFGLTLPEGITVTGVPTFSSSWPLATGTVSANAAFASSEVIAGTAVDNLVTISLHVGSGVAVGSYNVTLSDIQFRYGSEGAHDDAANVTFKVNVVNAHTVILDETSTTAPTAATSVNVRVKRTINANEWSTICLPFAMTATQCQTAFGSDVLLGDFTGCDVDADNNVKAKFASVTAIEANHPYIIKVGTVISEFAVNNVNVAAEEEPSVDKDEATTGSGRNKVTTYNSFIGNYVNGTTVPDYALFLNGGKFYFSKGATKIKGFRGYFDFATAGAEYEESRLFIVFNEATGIDSMHHSECTDEVYNLKGQRVDQPAKGLYIKGGKKVIIK